MSEPRNRADRASIVAPGLWHWTILDERIDFRSDAYAVAGDDGSVLIDPLPAGPGVRQLFGRVAAILLTSASHQRAAWSLRRELSVPVHSPAGAHGLDESADEGYSAGAQLPGGLQAVAAPGPVAPHYALLLRKPGATALFCGDLIMLPDDGAPRLLPEPHMADPAAGRRSARALAELDAGILCPAHGAPRVCVVSETILQALENAG